MDMGQYANTTWQFRKMDSNKVFLILLFTFPFYSKIALWQISSAEKMFAVKMLVAKMFSAEIPRIYVEDLIVFPLKSIVTSNESPLEGRERRMFKTNE